MPLMTNAEAFRYDFGIYATELWSMTEEQFLEWLDAEFLDAEFYANARWKGEGMGDYRCSLCGFVVSGNGYNFCPACGAFMEEPTQTQHVQGVGSVGSVEEKVTKCDICGEEFILGEGGYRFCDGTNVCKDCVGEYYERHPQDVGSVEEGLL